MLHFKYIARQHPSTELSKVRLCSPLEWAGNVLHLLLLRLDGYPEREKASRHQEQEEASARTLASLDLAATSSAMSA